jgi:biopolymer transport protein ExbD
MSNYVPLTPIGAPAEEPLPPQQSFPPPPRKKSYVMVWVLAGCVIAVFLGGYFAWNKMMKEAGLDPELMQKSPALAFAKMWVSRYPDVLEFVSVDDEKRLITIRNKKTSETFTLDMDAKDMSMVFAIPNDGDFYIGRDKVAQADTPASIRSILKDKPADEQVVYIKSGKVVKYGTVVSVIDSIRDSGLRRNTTRLVSIISRSRRTRDLLQKRQRRRRRKLRLQHQRFDREGREVLRRKSKTGGVEGHY